MRNYLHNAGIVSRLHATFFPLMLLFIGQPIIDFIPCYAFTIFRVGSMVRLLYPYRFSVNKQFDLITVGIYDNLGW
ncbi:hypothetical protein D3C71_2098900 [compost metagenome]